MSDNIWIFLLSAVGISLSGVMLPGPLTAATIAKGYNDKNAGVLIGLGHGIVELPIIALIYFGLSTYLTNPIVKQVSGLAGGLLLVVMGLLIFVTLKKPISESSILPYNSLTTGIMMTGGNPYFFLWWATIGLALITGAAVFGIIGLLLFVFVHWSCDIIWSQILSTIIFKTRHLWTLGVQKTVFGICALVLVSFGLWFGISVFL
jgi:threonine/homoserine/homoserine lactone efflux protein